MNFGLREFSKSRLQWVLLSHGARRSHLHVLLIKSGNQPLSLCRESLVTYSYQTGPIDKRYSLCSPLSKSNCAPWFENLRNFQLLEAPGCVFHLLSLCHNLVATLSLGCHKVVTVSITKLFQACHKLATRLLWQPCGSLVTSLSFLYGCPPL